MTATFQWTSGIVRFHSSDEDARSHSPYREGVVMVNRSGDAHAYLFGLHANMTRARRAELVECLIAQGITHTTDVRHGRWREINLHVEQARA